MENPFGKIKLSESEKESGSSAYLMSLMIAFIGLPLPIINTFGILIFFLLSKKKSAFISFHTLQALLSQIFIAIINSIAYSWTIYIFLNHLNFPSHILYKFV